MGLSISSGQEIRIDEKKIFCYLGGNFDSLFPAKKKHGPVGSPDGPVHGFSNRREMSLFAFGKVYPEVFDGYGGDDDIL